MLPVILLIVLSVLRILIVGHILHLPLTLVSLTRKDNIIQKVIAMYLPIEFEQRLKKFPNDTYNEYIAAFNKPAFSGYRVNTLKADLEGVHNIIGGERTSFCNSGFYLDDNRAGLGRHPLHHAGAIYIQEPSAMSAVTALNVHPGERVLDLCAAPGGKSTQIACSLCGEGLLVANEFVLSRAKILLSNIERMGISNAVVTSLHPDALCQEYEGYFDKILVDAPCSGEGMFRKEPAATENWNVKNVETCAVRQRKILDSAALALREGGVMAYSTCTFSPDENEQTVATFLASHPNFCLISINADFGIPAFSQFAQDTPDITLCRRVFPAQGGEGHFVALFQKSGDEKATDENTEFDTPPSEFISFWEKNFIGAPPTNIKLYGDKIYAVTDLPKRRSIKPLRDGLLLGELIKRRFEPSHALFMCAKYTSKQVLDLGFDDERINSFLKGEQLNAPELSPGYVGVRVLGIPCGFGKASNGVLKNHYPKGLRLL